MYLNAGPGGGVSYIFQGGGEGGGIGSYIFQAPPSKQWLRGWGSCMYVFQCSRARAIRLIPMKRSSADMEMVRCRFLRVDTGAPTFVGIEPRPICVSLGNIATLCYVCLFPEPKLRLLQRLPNMTSISLHNLATFGNKTTAPEAPVQTPRLTVDPHSHF